MFIVPDARPSILKAETFQAMCYLILRILTEVPLYVSSDIGQAWLYDLVPDPFNKMDLDTWSYRSPAERG